MIKRPDKEQFLERLIDFNQYINEKELMNDSK